LADGRGDASTKSGTPKLKTIAVERRQAARPPITGVVAPEATETKERLPALRLPLVKEGGEDKEGPASLKSASE